MTKAELVAKMAHEAGISGTEARIAMEAMIDTIVKTVRKGEKVSISGFGTFNATMRNGRKGKEAQGSTGKCRAPKFTAGKPLKDSVKQPQ